MIMYFIACLCITKNENFSAFLHELYRNVQYLFFLLKCSVFGFVPNRVASMGLWCKYN